MINDESEEARILREYETKMAAQKIISPEDAELDAKIAIEYEGLRKNTLQHMMGYVPQKHISIRYDSILRSQLKMIGINPEKYHEMIDDMYDTVREIRNNDMLFHSRIRYKAGLYEMYESYYAEYKSLAQKRLNTMLGYEPDIETSIFVEIVYRKIFAESPDYFKNDVTEHDNEGYTIVKFREVLLKDGLESAYKSPLQGYLILDRIEAGKIKFQNYSS